MSMNDWVSDGLARVKNGGNARLKEVTLFKTKLVCKILDILLEEGYIKSYKEKDVNNGTKELVVSLKYFQDKPVIERLIRVSKPSCRIYISVDDLAPFKNGLGLVILSTSKGILTDHDARLAKVGGEILCKVF